MIIHNVHADFNIIQKMDTDSFPAGSNDINNINNINNIGKQITKPIHAN